MDISKPMQIQSARLDTTRGKGLKYVPFSKAPKLFTCCAGARVYTIEMYRRLLLEEKGKRKKNSREKFFSSSFSLETKSDLDAQGGTFLRPRRIIVFVCKICVTLRIGRITLLIGRTHAVIMFYHSRKFWRRKRPNEHIPSCCQMTSHFLPVMLTASAFERKRVFQTAALIVHFLTGG